MIWRTALYNSQRTSIIGINNANKKAPQLTVHYEVNYGEEEGDDDVEDPLIDNAGEGDEDGEFLLPGLEATSEESEEDAEAMAVQEQELYMSQFVDASDDDADRSSS